jgi:hypothetical protein
MITLSDPRLGDPKKKSEGYRQVLEKTLGDSLYSTVPTARIDQLAGMIDQGGLMSNPELPGAIRYLVDNYNMNLDSLGKNIVDYHVKRDDLGYLGTKAEEAKIGAGMALLKRMNFTGGLLQNGDPKKKKPTSTGYAALDARLARLAEQAQSDSIPQTPQGGYLDKEGRKTVQRYYESSNNPLADSGFAKGLYGISEAAMTDAIRAGVIPAGADVTDPEVNLKVRNYMLNALAEKDFIKNPPKPISPMNRRSRIYMAYNFGGNKLLRQMEAAKAAGADIYNDDPRVFINFRAPKGTPGAIYDGYFYPKETRDYGAVMSGAEEADPNRLPKEIYEKYYNQK